MKQKTLIMLGAENVFFPYLNRRRFVSFRSRYPLLRLLNHPKLPWFHGLAAALLRRVLHRYRKIVFIGTEPRWALHPAMLELPAGKVFYYLWDPIASACHPPLEELRQIGQRHKVYSFQQSDCGAYGFSFNSTMYVMPPQKLLLKNPEEKFDAMFVGCPKERLPLLREIYDAMRAQNLRPRFRISLRYDPGLTQERKEGWELFSDYMPYIECLHLVQQSRTILDLYQRGQTGFSLRVMEHIFFGKKLITDNAVIKEAEFYHPNNIFLLQERDITELKDWLDLPFVPISEEIKEYYKFENWAERFV